jgi:hypothetical protein
MAGSLGVALLGTVLNTRLGDELGRLVRGPFRVDSIDHDALAASLHTVFYFTCRSPLGWCSSRSRSRRYRLEVHPTNRI